MNEAASAYALDWFKKRGVTVILSERVNGVDSAVGVQGPHTLTTSAGRTITADIVFSAIGA